MLRMNGARKFKSGDKRMNMQALHAGYADGSLTPAQMVDGILRQIAAEGARPVWISLVPEEEVRARAEELAGLSAEERGKLALYGIPFAVKDNINVAGMQTTAGCPAYAYVAAESATVVRLLEAAGAVLMGKTNMDQFATGLVGTRSPYGVCKSVFGVDQISGGSSSGSAVAVASGLVTFALGTDTAGSGRVPAMFNNLVGLKPTRGAVSAHGVVPACRTLDCVSIFAETAGDAAAVLEVLAKFDAADAYSRQPGVGAGAAPWAGGENFRFGVPRAAGLEFFDDELNAGMFRAAVEAMKGLGGEPVEFDLGPFTEAARLLYQGPWVAERLAATGEFFDQHAEEMDPIVRRIVGGAAKYSAADVFKAMYTLEGLKRTAAGVLSGFDFMLLPTTPRTYTTAEIAEKPVERNSHLGHYTNFVNLLDLSAVAVPAGMRVDGLPFGVSLIGAAFAERALLPVADRLHRVLNRTVGAGVRLLSETAAMRGTGTPHGCLLMMVVGAHLTGQPLNWQLTQRGGRLVRTTRTSGEYRFYALKNTTPLKPGLVREPGFAGAGIEVEVWALPAETVGSFVDGVPQPLTIGKLQLADGSVVMGFLVEPAAVGDATEITQFGGWRSYLQSLKG